MLRTWIRSSFFALLVFTGCVQVSNPFSELPPGIWRAALELKPDLELPFNFEVSYINGDSLMVTILNSDERIEVRDIEFGRNERLEDTIRINFPLMDSHISALYKENVIEGHWTVHYRDDYHIPFRAYHGQSHRFSTNQQAPANDISGTWKATFEIETEDVYPAVGEFRQNGNRLIGTFMTEIGDYRFLEGEIQGSEIRLSCFDGGHAFLFTANLSDEETMLGKFYSGKHYETNWLAQKDEKASLSDPNKLSVLKYPGKPLNFSLPNGENRIISIDDPKYLGKPKLVTIMGTWCPNCLDESRFISEYLSEHPEMDIEVIAVAFEKYRDRDKALQKIKTYRERLSLPYEIVLGGFYDKEEATKQFDVLDEIISYPTLLYVNRNNQVVKVHTGFTGPATSQYLRYKEEFKKEVKKLVDKPGSDLEG